ncbi:unnamed protein product [Paramecium sonneborni]|uniref:Transmembrane protein n=1 Tax=Paramecium sonneborni TaxID=65129 RepID=A0A8S1M187_9CILI|nr:unnamed protein product [Paramecium sonneborni]
MQDSYNHQNSQIQYFFYFVICFFTISNIIQISFKGNFKLFCVKGFYHKRKLIT